MSSSPPPAHDLHASQRSQASASASSEYDTDQDASFDDDMEFDLAQELLEGEEMEDDEDYEDASEGYEVEFEVTDESREGMEEPSGDNEDGEETETEATANNQRTRPIAITQQQLLQLLGQRSLRALFANHLAGGATLVAADDDEDTTPYFGAGMRRRRRRPSQPVRMPPVPNPEGQKLMESGKFGTNEPRRGTLNRKKKMAYRTMMRELGLGSPGTERGSNNLISHDMIPSSSPDSIINYNSRCYSGQFSEDGNFFFTCSQDFKVRMYDTSNPYRWKYYKTANYYGGQWTITDATLSPDNKYLAYSSIRPIVSLAPTDPENDADPHTLDFANMDGSNSRSRGGRYGHWGIWSLRFSGDGREIVAGTSDYSVYVYDVEANRSILRIPGHSDDVNAVCYGDKSSPHILYSGSDDTTIKVWDRRSLGDGREAGVFLGHTEGVTYIDSKGDGRHVISNSKDQTMKLWDMRKMISPDKAATIEPLDYSSSFDYRYPPYDEPGRMTNPHDCSLVTFRGHEVLRTLIRCHFSPPGSTDGRYVYSGSHDGSVYIWNLDATLKGKIDVLQHTKHTRPAGDARYADTWSRGGGGQWQTIVRDVSWHPNAPVIAATAWNGWDHGFGTCTVHSWNDGMQDDEAEPRMGARMTGKLEHDQRYYQNTDSSHVSQFRRERMRGAQLYDDDDDDDGDDDDEDDDNDDGDEVGEDDDEEDEDDDDDSDLIST